MNWFNSEVRARIVMVGDKRAAMHRVATRLEQDGFKIVAIWFDEEKDKSVLEYKH